MRRLFLGAVVLLVAASAGLAARAGRSLAPISPDTAAFVEAARAATRRYASRQQAVDDGFVRVGVEFPAMGEHWVSFARVMEDTFAADRPSVLIYVNVGGEPRLGGVAYTKLLSGHVTPPAFPSPNAWHEHSGGVDEESLPLHRAEHAGGSDARRGIDAPRLFILHVWIWTPNPAGTFVTDNWSLPALRLGVRGGPLPTKTTRGIGLALDRRDYHHLMLRTALQLTPSEDSTAAQIIALAQSRALGALNESGGGGTLEPEVIRGVEEAWRTLWIGLERELPGHRAQLEQLRAQMER